MEKDTLFNEDDEKDDQKKEQKDKTEEDLDELDLEDEDEDIIPIEETGGSGRKILWTVVVLIIIGLGIYSFAKREQIRESLKTPEEGEVSEEAADTETLEEFSWEAEGTTPEATTVEEKDDQIAIKEAELPQLEEFEENVEGKEETAPAPTVEPEEPAAPAPVAIPVPAPISLEPKIEMDNEKAVVKAQTGEGITHLARRALAEYLAKNNKQSELNNEQKIYVEDYLQNKTGTDALQLGESRDFTVALIDEAIQASKQLDEGQLKNLEKYSQVVFGASGS